MPATSDCALRTQNKKCRLSGKNCGHACEDSPCETSSEVRGTGSPPAAETRHSGVVGFAVKRITFSRLHVPPYEPISALHIVSAGPPDASILLSLPSAKNAM